MVERIERVARVKRLEPKGSLSRYANQNGNGKKFAYELRAAMDRNEEEETSTISEAYSLDIQRATQSLFYGSKFDLGAIGGVRL